MAIIYTYPISPPVGTDLLVGTRSGVPRNPTRNFSVDQLAVYIIDNLNGANLTIPIFFDTVNPTTGLVETTLVDSIMTQNANPGGTTLTIAGNISVTGSFADSNGNTGAANQVLTSTVTGTTWALVSASTEIIPFQNVDVVTANHTGALGTFPSVTVVNPNNIVVLGEIRYITTTQLTITFSSAQTGNVYLN
jgi:hypothetical protein